MLGVAGSLVATAPAAATTFTVTRTDDPIAGTCTTSCSLRQAVTAANAHPGADVASMPPGTYMLSQGELPVVSDPLTLLGSGAGVTTITGSTQSGSPVAVRAGVLDGEADLTVVNLTISGNTATVTNPTTDTLAVAAGGIVQDGGTLTLLDAVISGNTLNASTTTGAGGVSASTGLVQMINSTVSGNANLRGGTTVAGGIALVAGAVPSNIVNSTVSGNSVAPTATTTSSAGGVIAVATGLNMTDATVSGNTSGAASAASSVGGISSISGAMTVTNATIAENTATGPPASAGNLAAIASGTRTLGNTIIASGSGGLGGNCVGTFTSEGGNIESTNQCGLSTALGDQPSTNPLLGPLQDNGGPTPTRAIGPGSPALDNARAAFCPATDQRGVTRPQGRGCDVGAFEFGPPVNLASPSLAGTARVGVTLSCSPGSWRGNPSFTFAWLRNGSPIPVTSSAIYKLDVADRGAAVQCRVTAANSAGAATAVSNALGVAALPLPVNQRRPSISGTLRSGSKVRCNAGRWSGSPALSLAWLSDGRSIRHATGARYKIASRNVGHALQCQVTARNPGGSVVALSSPRVPAKAKPKRRTNHR
jgi:hypothetical protein